MVEVRLVSQENAAVAGSLTTPELRHGVVVRGDCIGVYHRMVGMSAKNAARAGTPSRCLNRRWTGTHGKREDPPARCTGPGVSQSLSDTRTAFPSLGKTAPPRQSRMAACTPFSVERRVNACNQERAGKEPGVFPQTRTLVSLKRTCTTC